MFETALAQMRFAASIFFGLPFNPRSLERLVEGLVETRREFGTLSNETVDFVSGPTLDEDTRREVQLRGFRRQAALAARGTTFYAELFESTGVNPKRISYEELSRLPVTSKTDVRENGEAFVNSRAKPVHLAMTTGTTGRPTSIWFSAREMQSFFALSAIGLLIDGCIRETDIIQVTTSSRATLGNSCFIEAAARLGASVYQTGLLEPAVTLALLTQKRELPGKKSQASILNTYPSYLGKLIDYARAHGYGPGDFGLERIILGGEIVTSGVKQRAQEVFGEVAFSEGYGMTEPWPFGGTLCEEGHLHFEPSQGLMEVLSLDDTGPAAPGALGRLVLTPFMPFRETTILLRYDTEDVVRWLPGPHTCRLRHLPATTHVLGKQRLSVHHAGGWVFPRPVLEALESVEEVPLPARCSFWAARDGVNLQVVAPDRPEVRERITASLLAHGVPLQELHLLDNPARLRTPYPWRGDLLEIAFRTDFQKVDGELA